MELFHNRYKLEQTWKKAEGGDLAFAKDMKLNRNILLWRTSVQDEKQKETVLRRLGNAARFADRRFVHILDVAVAGDDLYAVLTRDNGALLTDRLGELDWSGKEILERLRDLLPAIREARRERLQEFAVTADNIWMDGEGKLRIMNSWTEAGNDRRDVRGLALLLYQLCSRSWELPSSMARYNEALHRSLASLPGGTAEEAAEWAGSAFLPSCTLRDYELRLNRLLEPCGSNPVPSAVPVAAPKHKKQPAPPEKQAEPAKQAPVPVPAAPSRSSFTLVQETNHWGARLRPWIIYSLVLFSIGMVGVLGLWYATRLPTDDKEKLTHSSSSPTAAAVSASSSSSPTPAAAKSSSGRSSPSSSASPASASASAKPSAAPAVQENAVVPDLTNRTLEEASKLALAAGLKYQYQLEPHDTDKGLVFKQDLKPGTPVAKGDRIIFWVSKGK